MKRSFLIIKVLTLTAIMLFPDLLFAQDQSEKTDNENIRAWVEAQNYVFKADRVLPLTGPSKILTSIYDLVVSKDTIKAWLPYFGRAYRAPMDPSEGGIKFTSTQFDYQLTKDENGGWEVMIKPEDVRDVQQLTLHISKSGYANLHVISTHRQAISFNGKIIENKKR